MASYPHEDASNLAQEKSEETYKDWEKYWKAVHFDKAEAGIFNVIGMFTSDCPCAAIGLTKIIIQI